MVCSISWLSQLDEKIHLWQFYGAWSFTFLAFIFLIRQTNHHRTRDVLSWTLIFVLPLFMELPYLSNDYFRFLWDGELSLLGISPFDYNPNEALSIVPLSDCYWLDLHGGMGSLSNENYSCYPIFNQFLFLIGGLFSNDVFLNLTVLRLIQLASLLVGFYLLRKLLAHFAYSEKWALLFLWNPLVLIESIGNVHFELIMLVLVLAALYFMLKEGLVWSALCLALAVQTKLLPLILLPFLLRYLGWSKTIGYSLLTFGFIVAMSFPLFDFVRLQNFAESLALYFGRFEFNSILLFPYLEYGEMVYGWNLTDKYAPQLSQLSVFMILVLAFYGGSKSYTQMLERFFWGLLIYFCLTSTLHPWYWIFPLGLAILLQKTFLIGICFFAGFSYGLYTYGYRGEFQWMLWCTYPLIAFSLILNKWLKKDYFSSFLRLDSGTGS